MSSPFTSELVIPHELDRKSIKDILYGHFALSTNAVKGLKYNGKILLDGKEVTVRENVSAHQHLTLVFPQSTSESIVPVDLPTKVLYEDEHLLAVNKPFGMPTHPSHGHRTDTLANAVMYKYGGNFVFRPITRLDIDTTGVVLIAKNAVVCHKLCSALADNADEGLIRKTYLALCTAVPKEKRGTIDAPIGRLFGSVLKRCVREDGQRSVTNYEVLEQSEGRCLVKAMPLTGRTHQIRVHMAYIGCPLVGDYLYGTEIAGTRTMLHCESVEFLHPISRQNLCIKAPMPEDMCSIIKNDGVI